MVSAESRLSSTTSTSQLVLPAIDGSSAAGPGTAASVSTLLWGEASTVTAVCATATVDPGKTFGASVNFGTFNGESAVGLGGAIQALDGLTFTGAVGFGLNRGTSGGRAGVNFSW